MDRLIQTRLFRLVESEQDELESKEKWKEAYISFAEELFRLTFSEQNFTDRYNILTFTLAEIESLRENLKLTVTKKKNNDVRFLYLEKAKFIVTAQVELLNLSLKYPSKVVSAKKSRILSPLFWSEGFTKRDLIELLTAIDQLGVIKTVSGERASFQTLAQYCEWLFNIELSRPHDKRREVLARKIKTTSFIQRLLDALTEKSRE